MHGKSNGQQHSKLVMCMACDIEATYQQQNEQQNNRQRTNKTQFFTNDGKYKVIFRFWQIQIFLSGFAQTQTKQSTRTNGNQGLTGLPCAALTIGEWVKPRLDSGLEVSISL